MKKNQKKNRVAALKQTQNKEHYWDKEGHYDLGFHIKKMLLRRRK